MRGSTAAVCGLVALASITGCCVHPIDVRDRRAFVSDLQDKTVALVHTDEEDSHPRIYCSGVWVSPFVILTAEHCVAMLGRPEDPDGDGPRWNPVGQRAMYRLRTDDRGSYRTGLVLTDDYADDLATILVDAPYFVHPYARVGDDVIYSGDAVEIVGHPAGYGWSYTEGVVAAWLPDEPGVGNHRFNTLQISAPLSGGNSGGGLYDSRGRLIGIASYMSSRLNGMGFFVHRDAISAFLAHSGVV